MTTFLQQASSTLDYLISSSWVIQFKAHAQIGSLWTYQLGCLLYTSITLWNLIFVQPEPIQLLHKIVILLLIFGLVSYSTLRLALTSILRQSPYYTNLALTVHNYIFMGLSFILGLYFSFYFENLINRLYFGYHVTTSTYLLYKRFKSFELAPFLLGFGLSLALLVIHPTIHWFLADALGGGAETASWAWSSITSGIETVLYLGLALVFMLRLPEQYLPPNAMFGLKIAKYLMFWSCWETWFILMVVASWKNLGAMTQATCDTVMVKETSSSMDADDNKNKSGPGPGLVGDGTRSKEN